MGWVSGISTGSSSCCNNIGFPKREKGVKEKGRETKTRLIEQGNNETVGRIMIQKAKGSGK